jgi:hypothetical protein
MDEFVEARRAFGVDKAEIEQFMDQSVVKLFDKAVGDPSGKGFVKTLVDMDEGEFVKFIKVVDDHSPGLGRETRAAMFERMIQQNTKFDSLRSSADLPATTFDSTSFLKKLNKMGMSKMLSFIDSGMPAADAKTLRNTLIAFEAIASGPAASGKVVSNSIKERMGQFAINAASQDAGFISRLLAGEFAPGMIERILFTPEGQSALSTLGKPRPGRALFANAMNVLVEAMRADTERTTAQREGQAQARQAQDPLNVQGQALF